MSYGDSLTALAYITLALSYPALLNPMTTATDQGEQTAACLCDLFGHAPEDAVQETLQAQPQAAAEAGLPAIVISADVGRLLSLFTRLATRSNW